MAKRFSGKISESFWGAVNRVGEPDRKVFYKAGCYTQEMEAEIERLRKVIWRVYRERAARIKCNTTEVLLRDGHSEFAIWERRCEIDEMWMREAADDTKLNEQESQGYRWALEPEPEAVMAWPN